MTTIAERRTTRDVSAPSRRRAPGALVLARAEGTRLVRHPLSIVALAIGFATVWRSVRWWTPLVSDREDAWVAVALYPYAIAMYFLAASAHHRNRRNRTTELYSSAPIGAQTRTAGLICALAYPTAVATAFAIVVAAVTKLGGGVGWPNAYQLLSGPALVAFFGSLAVLLARWVPTLVAGPLVLLPLLTIDFTPWGRDYPLSWTVGYTRETPRELLNLRPGWHLAFMAALVALAIALTFVWYGARPRRLAAVAGATLLFVAAGSIVLRPASPERIAHANAMIAAPERFQVCESHGSVRYCAFDQYRSWIQDWESIVRRVLAGAPAQVRARSLAVRQVLTRDPGVADAMQHLGVPVDPAIRARVAIEGFDSFSIRDDGAVHPDTTSWDSVGVETALWAVGLPIGLRTWTARGTQAQLDAYDALLADHGLKSDDPLFEPPPAKPGEVYTYDGACDGSDRARTIVMLWLWSGAGDAELRAMAAGEALGPASVLSSRDDARTAYELGKQPRERVASGLARHWSELTNPATPATRLRALLGVEAQRAEPDPDLGRAYARTRSVLCP